MPPEEDRAMVMGNMHKNLVKIGHVVLDPEVKREDNQNYSVLCCVRQLYTMISTLRWAVLTVLWTVGWT